MLTVVGLTPMTGPDCFYWNDIKGDDRISYTYSTVCEDEDSYIEPPGGFGGPDPHSDEGIPTSPIVPIGNGGDNITANELVSNLNLTNQAYIDWINNPINGVDITSIYGFCISENWSRASKSFAISAIDFLLNKPNVSFDYMINNRTDFDSNQGEIDDYVSGGFDATHYSNFNSQQTWPSVSPVISKNNFIGWGATGIRRNCMDYAKAQIALKGYQISSYFNNGGQTIQIFTSQNGVNFSELQKGLNYLNYALTNGIPVIVGIDDLPNQTKNPDTDNTTDHFVVIVGMGSDINGNYFTFYDNASSLEIQGASSQNKLYYDSQTGLISGNSETNYAEGLTYTITMIRKSKRI